MLISKIQKDLFNFVDPDPEDRDGLIEFWYSANSNALSAALTKEDGLKLILNVSSFAAFEELSKKLFLIADTLILRDIRRWTPDEVELRDIPIPDEYKPGYWEELSGELKKLRPSPLTLLYRPNLYWTSTEKVLNNGHRVHYASWDYISIPDYFVNWMTGSGRSYMETGKIVYAPFIPPLDMELEFLKNDVFLPDYFNGQPCFHQQYDWLNQENLNTLFSLKFPFLDNLDIETISKVKDDHNDAFLSFSSSLLDSINSVKALFGTADFVKEARYIQKHQIDDEINKIGKTIKKIESYSSLRKMGILAGLTGLNAALHLGASAPALATGAAATESAGVRPYICH